MAGGRQCASNLRHEKALWRGWGIEQVEYINGQAYLVGRSQILLKVVVDSIARTVNVIARSVGPAVVARIVNVMRRMCR